MEDPQKEEIELLNRHFREDGVGGKPKHKIARVELVHDGPFGPIEVCNSSGKNLSFDGKEWVEVPEPSGEEEKR